MKIFLLSTIVLFSAAAAASGPPAAKPAAQPAAKPAAKPVDPAATSGMQVHLDPKTGELTERPVAPLSPALSRGVDTSKIVEIRHADGSTETLFNGQADSTLVVEADADGALHYRCNEHGELHAHGAASKEPHDDRQ